MFKARWGEWNLASGISFFGTEMGAATICTWLWTSHCYGKAPVVAEIVCTICPLSIWDYDVSLFCTSSSSTFWNMSTTRNRTIGHSFSITFWALLFCCCLVAQSCLTLCKPMDCSPTGSSVHGTFPGKNTGVSCDFLLQGIFLTRRSKPGLLHCKWILLLLNHQDIYKSPKDIYKMCNSLFFLKSCNWKIR